LPVTNTTALLLLLLLLLQVKLWELSSRSLVQTHQEALQSPY
jgi:hypothetical protein